MKGKLYIITKIFACLVCLALLVFAVVAGVTDLVNVKNNFVKTNIKIVEIAPCAVDGKISFYSLRENVNLYHVIFQKDNGETFTTIISTPRTLEKGQAYKTYYDDSSNTYHVVSVLDFVFEIFLIIVGILGGVGVISVFMLPIFVPKT